MPCRLPSCVPEVPQEPCSEPGLRAGATTTIHHRCTGTSGVPQEPSTRAIAQGSVWTNLVTQAKREPVFPRPHRPSMIIVDSCVLHSCRRRMEHLRPSNASKQQLTSRVRTVGRPPHEGRGKSSLPWTSTTTAPSLVCVATSRRRTTPRRMASWPDPCSRLRPYLACFRGGNHRCCLPPESFNVKEHRWQECLRALECKPTGHAPPPHV